MNPESPAGAARTLPKSVAGRIEVGPVSVGMNSRAHAVTPGVTVRGRFNSRRSWPPTWAATADGRNGRAAKTAVIVKPMAAFSLAARSAGSCERGARSRGCRSGAMRRPHEARHPRQLGPEAERATGTAREHDHSAGGIGDDGRQPRRDDSGEGQERLAARECSAHP